MNKKEKIISCISIFHFVLLLLMLLAILLSIVLRAEGTFYLILIFFLILLGGFLVISILKIRLYRYICPTCQKEIKMNFFQIFTSKSMDTKRLLYCDNCKKKAYMERTNH